MFYYTGHWKYSQNAHNTYNNNSQTYRLYNSIMAYHWSPGIPAQLNQGCQVVTEMKVESNYIHGKPVLCTTSLWDSLVNIQHTCTELTIWKIDISMSKNCQKRHFKKKLPKIFIFFKKITIFFNFFEKNVKFLAIFWQSNGNFPEGQNSHTLKLICINVARQYFIK